MSRIWIGVDVCKDFLDAHARPGGVKHRFDNTPAGIEQLVAWAQAFTPQPRRVGIHRPLSEGRRRARLLAADLPAVVVNARQVRDFAKGTGQLAKTDRIDAGILAHFGEVVATVVRPLPATEVLEFRDLCDRRGQLVRMLAAEKNHRHAVSGPARRAESSRTSTSTSPSCGGRSRNLEEPHGPHRRRSPRPSRPRTKFCNPLSASGRRSPPAPCWFTCPMLGQGSRQQIAALVGLAPFADDSGTSSRIRHIRGGRAKVRIALYQAAVSAIRFCTTMKAFYASLKARGKASKVALIAVARKLLVLANALLRTGTRYQPRTNSVCLENA